MLIDKQKFNVAPARANFKKARTAKMREGFFVFMSNKSFVRIAKKAVVCFVNFATIISMTAGPVFAAKPAVTNVTVTETSIKVTFDQGVNTWPNGTTRIETGDTTSYADDLRNYIFQSPTGTTIPLSISSPYSNWTSYTPSQGGATSTVEIYGMNLSTANSWNLAIQNIGTATSTPEIMDPASASGANVAASTDPIIDYLEPMYGTYASAGTQITFHGSNFPTATSTVAVACSDGDGDTELTVMSASNQEVVAKFADDSLGSYGRKDCYVRDSGTNATSARAPFFLYDENSGVLYGAIIDSDETTPVGNATLMAYEGTQKMMTYSGSSQSDGTFAVVVPGNASYSISVTTPGSGTDGAAPLTLTGNYVARGSAAEVDDIAFVDPMVTGTIYAPGSPQGAPLYGAQVTIHNQNWTVEQTAMTGLDGSYKFYVTPSASMPLYTIEVRPSDYDININNYLEASATVNVANSTPITKNVILSARNVWGVVKTPEAAGASNPYPDTVVPRVSVRLSNSMGERRANTNTSGQFEFGGIADGNYTLEFEAPFCGDSDYGQFCGYARTSSTVTISGNSNDLGVKRFSTPNFYGYVYGDTNSNNQYDEGEGISNAWVNISKDSFWSSSATDANGRYSFSLPASGTYRFNVQSTGVYASYSADASVVLPLTAAQNIKMSRPNVTGYIYGPDGSVGQAYTWVEACPSNAPGNCYGGQSDNTGAFSINVGSGDWELQARPDWNSFYIAPSPYTITIENVNNVPTLVNVERGGTADSTADATEPWTTGGVIIRLVDPATDESGFTGTVYDPTGTTAQQNIGIGMRPAEQEGSGCRGTGMSRWTQTNQQGRFAFSEITPGLYEIEAIPWGNSDYSRKKVCQTVSADDAATRSLDINLTSPNITGIIKTPVAAGSSNPTPDTAIAYAWVSFMQENSGNGSGGSYGGNTNENGALALGGVPAGTYTIEIQPGWNSAYSSRRISGITIDGNGNCITAGGGDEDDDANACDLNTLANVGDGSAVRVGTPNFIGQIRDPQNNVLPNAWVMVHTSNWTQSAGSNTDASGIFRIGGLDDGTGYAIEINLPWSGQQAAGVTPEGLTVDIVNGVGTVSLDGTPLANNVITLVSPTKTISGTVTKDGAAVTDARVQANKEMGGGFFETTTDANGEYELLVSGGSWWAQVMPSFNAGQPEWVYTEPPTRVTFDSNNTTQSKEVDFIVTAANATVTGTVKTPDDDAVQGGWVEVRGNKGVGSGGQTDNNGRFSIKVPAGTYFINVFSNSNGYGAPEQKSVTVAANQSSDAGTMYLKTKDAHIKGFVQDDSGTPVANVIVNAQMENNPGWAMTYTDQTGAYDLSVWEGAWRLMVTPMSQSYIYQGAAQSVEVVSGQTSNSNNFQLKTANKTLKIKVINQDTNELVNDVWGGVWVKDLTAGMVDFGGPMSDMMEKSGMTGGGGDTAAGGGGMMAGQGMEQGGFSGGALNNGYTEVKVPSGEFEIGLGMPPGSKYTLVENEQVEVTDDDTSKDIELQVKENLATISGFFYTDADNNDVYNASIDTKVTDIRAFINADKTGGGWQMTQTDDDGSYSLNVTDGDWYVNAFVDPMMSFGSGRYVVINDGEKVTVDDNDAGTDVTKNIKVKELDATISGTVYNADGTTSMDSSYGSVWVFADFGSKDTMDAFKGPGGPGLGTFTEADGTYTLNVPAGTYKIGAGIPPWDTRDLLNPDPVTVTVGEGDEEDADLTFKESDATISGQILLGGIRKPAFIRAWSDAGIGSGTVSDDGTYELKATQNDVWHIVAASEISNGYYESAELAVETNSGAAYENQDLTLVSQDISIPDPVSATFDASQSKTIKLTNGDVDEVVMEIPAGAIASSGTITVSITPTVNVKPDSKDKPIGLAYEFEARDASGNKIEEFSQDLTIYITYDPDMIAAAGYSEESITPKYYDTTTGSWENYSNVVRDPDNNRLIIKTDHFSAGGITGNGDIPAKPTGLTATAASSTSITLSWTDNSSNETGFKVYRAGVLVSTTAANATSYTDSGLSAETSYTYYVKATNEAGDSSASDSATGTTDSASGQRGGGSSAADSGSAEKKKEVVLDKPVTEMTQAELLAKIAEIQNLINELKVQLQVQSGAGYSEIPAAFKFSAKLKQGARGNDVKYLQIFLKAQGSSIYSEGLVTGYFGPMTRAAVIKFQEKYATDILAPFGLSAGTGIAGEKTMIKINALMER